MPITLPAVPPYFTSPKYDDRIVEVLQKDFIANLSWLTRGYHIARIGVNANDNYTYPQIQANDGTNRMFDIRPDNECASYCFFEVEQPYDANYESMDAKYYLSVIFWVNLKLIDAVETTDFTGALIKDVLKRLTRNSAGDFKVEENPEKIFNRYSGLKQETNQYLMKRYSAFKISFSVTADLTEEC